MARGNEIGSAYFSLIPSMDGTTQAINSQLGVVTGASSAVGRAGGASMGAGIAGGLKAAGVVGLAFGAVGLLDSIGTYFSEATTKASDLAESANAISVTFGEQADEVARLGETAATRLGLSQVAFNGIATRFSAFAGAIAGEGGDVVGVLDELTTRGADFASVFNIDVDEALGLFQSGLAGETEPLRRFGLDLSAAAVEAFAAANGIGDGTGALTEAEKVQARYGLLLAQTAQTQGDFANTSDSLANSQRIANAQFENAQAKIGEALLPAAEKFSAWMLEDGVPLVEKLVDIFIKLEPAITFVVDAFIAWLDTVIGVTDFVVGFFDAIGDGVATTDELRNVFSKLPQPLQDAAIAISQFLFDTFRGFYNFGVNGINGLIGFINGFLAGLRPVVSFLNDVFGTNYRVPQLGTLATLNAFSFSNMINGIASTQTSQGSGGRLAMAEGGIVTARPGGVAATIGEGRFDEAVIPLSPSVLAQLGQAIGGTAGMTVNITNPDPYVVVDQMEQRLSTRLAVS